MHNHKENFQIQSQFKGLRCFEKGLMQQKSEQVHPSFKKTHFDWCYHVVPRILHFCDSTTHPKIKCISQGPYLTIFKPQLFVRCQIDVLPSPNQFQGIIKSSCAVRSVIFEGEKNDERSSKISIIMLLISQTSTSLFHHRPVS